MSNSSLVSYTKILNHKNSPRNNTIKKITIHHMAGNLSLETCYNVLNKGGISANYGIDSNGGIGLYVDERDRAWTSASPSNDNQAVTIEVANNSGAPNWTVSTKAFNSLIDLCVDICKRNGIKSLNYTGTTAGNLTIHKMFIDTECPGPYLESRMPEIAKLVNERLRNSTEQPSKPTQPTNNPQHLKGTVICDALNMRTTPVTGNVIRVLPRGNYFTVLSAKDGWFKINHAGTEGYVAVDDNYVRVEDLNNNNKVIYFGTPVTGNQKPAQDLTAIAQAVYRGDYGNNPQRAERLRAEGYDPEAVQDKVNELYYS